MSELNENKTPAPDTASEPAPAQASSPLSDTTGSGASGGWYNPYSTYNGQAGIPSSLVSECDKKKKKKIPTWVIVLSCVIGAVVLLFGTLIAIGLSASDNGYVSLPGMGEEYVAVMYIDDEIAGDYVTTKLYGSYSSYNQVFYIDNINAMIEDPCNVGLMLYINSPGGEVTATDELSRAIKYYKQQTGRALYAYFGDMAASGAYWIGSCADKIIASPYCTTGSIGVTYGTHIEISELLTKLGITVTELTAGENKSMGSMYSPLTDSQKRMYAEQLSEMHDVFVQTVAENRDLTVSEVKKIADGRTFLASKALKYKLIDQIGYWEDAQRVMIEDLGLGEEVVIYECINTSYSLDSMISLFMESLTRDKKTESSDVAALIEKIGDNRRFMAKYN